ncbi:MAG: hypothetical protein SVV80_09950 [Planctomycetota bacterium]|nr:hypothetical protein [Planctomycetota bacterium]
MKSKHVEALARLGAAVIFVTVLSFTCLTGPAGEQAPTSAPATSPAARLEAQIQAIRQADDPREAMSAYARGCALDRSNTEIHDAYMRRMMKFGLPKIAYYPANVLIRIDPDNSLAWGIVGYIQGRRGELADAFSSTIRSLENRRDDPSVLHNAGQLAAWYDSEPDPPRVSDRVRRSLAQMQNELLTKKQYSSAYKGIAAAYAQRAVLMEQLDKQFAAAEAEVLSARQVLMEIDGQLREINDEIGRRKRIIDEHWRELRSAAGYYYRNARGRIVHYHRYSRAYRDDLYDRIHQEEREVERLQSERRGIRIPGRAAMVELKGKEAVLVRLKQQMRKAEILTEREFRWDPPAVDGVVTPEIEHFPVSTRPAAPADPEVQAGQRLKLAQLYIRHEMNEKAVVILEGILEDYASTRAAVQAKILLAKLEPAD